MTRLGHVVALALTLLLALTGTAAAQQPLVPTETLAQEQAPPETVPQDEDDEELGEEIPDEDVPEPSEPDGDSGSSGGGSPTAPAQPPAQQARQLPRTGGDPLPLLAAAVVLLASGLALRAATRETAP